MHSMTGFATAGGEAAGRRWRWEAKSVNGRGLDPRFRLDDSLEPDEAALRKALSARLARGSVTINLRSEHGAAETAPRLNPTGLEAALEAVRSGEAAASVAGVDLAPTTMGQLLTVRGVMETAGDAVDDAAKAEIAAALLASFEALIDALVETRRAEGRRLQATIAAQLDAIEATCAAAETAFAAQMAEAPARLAEKVAAVMGAGAEVPPERLAQELALLAVKADVREELDRLSAHLAAARALIGGAGPIGRKLDFLTQEFNREANTLCAKAAGPALTDAGLELKVLIDQMREQAQNVE